MTWFFLALFLLALIFWVLVYLLIKKLVHAAVEFVDAAVLWMRTRR